MTAFAKNVPKDIRVTNMKTIKPVIVKGDIVLKINMPNGAVLEPELLQVNSIARAAELLSRLKITDLAYVDPIVLKYFWSNR